MDFINLFCLFCVILICFAGICPNMMREKKERKKIESKTRSLARLVPNVARPCLFPPLLKLIFFPFFHIQTTQPISPSTSLPKTPLNPNLPTFITPPKLHQIQQFPTTNSSSISIIQTHKPHLNPNPITKPTFPTQNLAKP